MVTKKKFFARLQDAVAPVVAKLNSPIRLMNPQLRSDPPPSDSPSDDDSESEVLSPPPATPGKRRRNGKIARLEKLERDMVCRMLWDGVAYERIVAALAEVGIVVTVRNVSNWKTRGGYQEWSEDQQRVLENRL